MGRFFFWGGDGRFSESVDVFLRERPLAALPEFPSEAIAGDTSKPTTGAEKSHCCGTLLALLLCRVNASYA